MPHVPYTDLYTGKYRSVSARDLPRPNARIPSPEKATDLYIAGPKLPDSRDQPDSQYGNEPVNLWAWAEAIPIRNRPSDCSAVSPTT